MRATAFRANLRCNLRFSSVSRRTWSSAAHLSQLRTGQKKVKNYYECMPVMITNELIYFKSTKDSLNVVQKQHLHHKVCTLLCWHGFSSHFAIRNLSSLDLTQNSISSTDTYHQSQPRHCTHVLTIKQSRARFNKA